MYALGGGGGGSDTLTLRSFPNPEIVWEDPKVEHPK